jgi:hypothetical protein
LPIDFQGEMLRPPSPVGLVARRQANGDLPIHWIRRSRTGFAWIDGVDAPLGESSEQYRVSVTGTDLNLELETTEPFLTIMNSDVVSLGPGDAVIEVRQIGDFAASHPARSTITLT